MDVGAVELALARRPAIVALTCLALTGAVAGLHPPTADAAGRGASSKEVSGDAPTVADTGAVTFSAVVHPQGRATTAFFEFGLAARYRRPRPSHPVYDMSTTPVHLAPASHVYSVSGRASGLVPDAIYDVRLVARSSAGTVYSPNATFRTAKDPAPPPPVIGAKMNLEPATGLVLIRRSSTNIAPGPEAAQLVAGAGFRPLTQPRQLPIGSQVDARAGVLRVVVADAQRLQRQRVTLAGGLFALTQSTGEPTRGLTTANLLEGDFRGAPSYAGCPTGTSTSPSSGVVQTVQVSVQAGRFRTLGRDSSATARAGAVWDTSDRCDGTLTVVRRGTVVVSDLPLQQTIAVHAGQRYLALGP